MVAAFEIDVVTPFEAVIHHGCPLPERNGFYRPESRDRLIAITLRGKRTR